MTIVALPKLDPVYLEWKKSLKTGNPYMCRARQQIAESWERCYQEGLDPYDDKIYYGLDDVNLHRVLQEKETLIMAAKDVMVKLHGLFKESGYIVSLTDEHGCILEVLSNEEGRPFPMNPFYPGVSWREDKAGTNAIGTALKLGKFFQVSGAEHYCKKNHDLTCSAALIKDSMGKVVGSLNIACTVHVANLQAMEIVEVFAEAITAQLNILERKRELIFFNKQMSNFINSVSDGVIIVDNNDVVIEINPAAKTILEKTAQHALGIGLTRLFDSKSVEILTARNRYHDVEIILDTQEGVGHYLASREPIVNDNNLETGSIIFLKSVKYKKNVTNRANANFAICEFQDIIGNSRKIREAIYTAKRAALTTVNVLLNGESGTGKEVFAQAIHSGSGSTGPFVAINCGAIPRELIGSELFGYVDGAFTGAKRGGKPGKFELASGGTLFLDEIGDMPLEQQIALLRIIQERQVMRIGSNKVIPVDIRLICATHRDLQEEVKKGTFRLDLFYRLNVLSIHIPPLRERREDIKILSEHFLKKLSHDHGHEYLFDPDCLAFLNTYDWPGNVRELQNVIEHATCLAETGMITAQQLLTKLSRQSTLIETSLPHKEDILAISREHRQKLAAIGEKNKIISTLNAFAGNVSRVAKELGISRNTLYNKMRLYAIKN